MRLIDADAFKEHMDYVCGAGGWLQPITSAVIEYVKKNIDAEQTVDGVKVVRCKNCKYRNWETNGCNRNPCVEPLYEDDFCSYGEDVETTL